MQAGRTVLALLCLLVPAGISPTECAAVDEFGSKGSAAGQLVEPQGIAVEQESGDLYIVDSNNYRVEKFTGAGVFLYAWGWGVADQSIETPQVCTTGCHQGLAGAGAGQLGFTEGVAVDNDPSSPSYGDVYIVDIGNLRVEKFSPTGEFLLMFGGGVNRTAHRNGEAANEDVCPIRPHDVCGVGTKGTGHGQFLFPSEGDFVAVGPDGTVYTADLNRVQEFSPSGVYERQIRLPPPEAGEGSEAGGIPGLVVNSIGDLYIIRNGVAGVNEYTPSGGLLSTLDYQGVPEGMEGPTPTMAQDSFGDLFVDEHQPKGVEYAAKPHRIVEYDPAGVEVASFDVGEQDGLHGLAFGDRAGRLYVVNANGDAVPIIMRVRIVTPPPPRQPFAPCGWCSWTGAYTPR